MSFADEEDDDDCDDDYMNCDDDDDDDGDDDDDNDDYRTGPYLVPPLYHSLPVIHQGFHVILP